MRCSGGSVGNHVLYKVTQTEAFYDIVSGFEKVSFSQPQHPELKKTPLTPLLILLTLIIIRTIIPILLLIITMISIITILTTKRHHNKKPYIRTFALMTMKTKRKKEYNGQKGPANNIHK